MTIKGRNISMVRGDSESITVTCDLPFEEGDELIMTVREDVESSVEFQKIVTEFTPDGAAVIDIDPEDTGSMDFGDYVYDLQLTRAGGRVTTLLPVSRFTLEEEVTYG